MRRRTGFTSEEDQLLRELVEKGRGDPDWPEIARSFDGKTGRQCRERWRNYLDGNGNYSLWTEKEDILLEALHRRFGRDWEKIAQKMKTGRTGISVRNRWESHLAKKVSSHTHVRASEYVLSSDFDDPDLEMPTWDLYEEYDEKAV
jgi:hypothetical protein